MATLAVVLALFTASAICSTCSSENNTLPSPVPVPTLATSTYDETMEVSNVMTVYQSDLWLRNNECMQLVWGLGLVALSGIIREDNPVRHK